MRTSLLVLTLGSTIALSTTASAWWDTRLEVTRALLPAEKEFAASSIAGGRTLEDDPQANGGTGGKALWLEKDAAPLSVKVTLEPGVYQWVTICRIRETNMETALFGLTLSKDGKQVGQWFLPGRVSGYYGNINFYFPIEEKGEYTVSLHVEKDLSKLTDQATKELPGGKPLIRFTEESNGLKAILESAEKLKGVLIERFEFASLLPSEPLKQRKQKAYLSKEEVLEALNVKPKEQADLEAGKITKYSIENLAAGFPEYNVVATNGRDGFDFRGLRRAALEHLIAGNEEAALYGSLLLVGLADKWPMSDYTTYIGSAHTALNGGSAPWSISWCSTNGKHLYRGWSPPPTADMIVVYDVLFDFIKTNPTFLEEVRKQQPELKTVDDVIAFLDERVLWVSARDYRRVWIGKDTIPPLIARVFGPGPEADKILETTVFDRIHTNMVHLGGIDDNAVTSFSRDGVRYISSSLYSDRTLIDLAQSLEGYEKSGGDKRFNFLSQPEGRSAQLNAYSLSAMRMGGGFRMVTGDGGSLHQVIEPGFETLPSRVLGSSGYTVLESGQFEDTPLKARAVGIYWGGGRGHAHSDTLNIELFAHSARMAPDLGGREEGKNFGRPNMRKNRVHNLVEIDDQDFWNPSLSIAPASGWLVSFAPARDGSQFTEHGASAQSHPHVSLYQRQTALISVPGKQREESYLFDVFRVKGGKTHSYNFHGAATDVLEVNSDLKPVEAHPFLAHHKEGTRQEGVAKAVLDARWPLTAELQKKYQGKNFEEGITPTTRLLLFGQEGSSVLVGNAHSEAYKYDFPFLYVRREGKEAMESLYPAVIELYAGEPFIRSAQLLTPTTQEAEAPVAIAVETVSGRSDLVYSAGRPEEKTVIGKGNEAAGRFAFAAQRGGQVEEARLVGGTLLATPQVRIEVPAGRIVRKIEKVDYAKREIVLDQPIPDSFKDATVTISNGSRPHAFNLEAVKGKTATLREYPGYYKSNLVQIGEDGLSFIGELEAEQSRWDTRFAKNTVLTNEDHSKQWRIDSFLPGLQWMTMSYPGYRWSFPIDATEADFPDLDGDGRRTVKLSTDPHTPKIAPAEPGEIDVVGVKDARIFFRIPDHAPEDSKLRLGGWSMNGFVMTPEGGKQTYFSRYSGQFLQWKVQSPIAKGDLNDANGDGKTKIYAFVFGVGDQLEADASIQVLYRPEAKLYQVETNTVATVTFPKGSFQPTKASFGNVKDQPLKTRTEQGAVIVEITPEMVVAGKVELR